MSWALGIDLGGTTARAALVDERGEVVRAERHVLTARAPQAVIDQLLGLARRLDGSAPRLPAAMGIAGELWLRTGVVAVAPNLGWFDVALGDLLASAFGHPVRLVNDLDAITVGEARRGAGRGERDVLCIFVGTGVGMGAICQGLLLEGADGLATELGHIKVASPGDGRLCGCGERGCLEAYTSGRHLPELLMDKARAGLPSPLAESARGDPSQLNAATIEAAACSGDAAARALWEDIAQKLGVATASMVTVLNPRVLVLGGGVLTLAPSLKDRLLGVMREACSRPALSRLEVRNTELGDAAGLVGAGLLAHEQGARS
jgi:glucokinase